VIIVSDHGFFSDHLRPLPIKKEACRAVAVHRP